MSSAPREDRSGSGISFQTLAIASVSSLIAAIVVHRVWQGGAIVGAAVTPVIVGIVGEALQRPVQRLTVVREGGRRLPADRTRDVPPVSRERGDDPFGLWEDDRKRKRGKTWLTLGIVTGIIGFAVAAFVLTGSELALGGSVSGGRKTTIFGGGTHTATHTTTVQQTSPTTEVPTVTQTVPAPAPEEQQQQTTPTVTQTTPTAPAPQQAAPQQQTTPATPTTTVPPATP